MSYFGLELLSGLTLVHVVGSYGLPYVPKMAHGFLVGALLCAIASLVCALACAMPRYPRNGRRVMGFCCSTTLIALLVAAKALAAGLFACS